MVDCLKPNDALRPLVAETKSGRHSTQLFEGTLTINFLIKHLG